MPESIADRYTYNQIADAVWFLFGVASGYFHDVLSDKVEIATQVACMRSVESFYLRLLDRVCCLRAGDPDGQYAGELKVDGAVFMIWEMDCIEGGIMYGEKWPHLVKPGFRVLERVLMKCRTSTCMMSVLHGLGHLHDSHPQQCEGIIDAFLAERRAPDWVRDYACDARTGHIL